MNFNELYKKIKDIDQRPSVEEGIMDTAKGWANQAGQAVQKAGQAVANTTLGDIGNAAVKYNPAALARQGINAAAQGITDVNKAAYGAVGNAAKAVGQKIAGAVAPAPQMAPVKPMNAFGGPAQAPEAEFGDLPPQSTAGAGRGSINPPMAGQPQPKVAAKPAAPAVSGAAIAGVEKAFAEDYDNKDIDECGLPGMSSMPSGMPGMSKQQDSVTMNVSMNGSGAGGIRDLMGILKNIESSGNSNPHPHDVDALFGGDSDIGAEVFSDVEEEQGDGGFGVATTRPNTKVAPVGRMLATGSDMHSKGKEAPKVNGGGNPMQESLATKLKSMYESIKGEKLSETDNTKWGQLFDKYNADKKAWAASGRTPVDFDSTPAGRAYKSLFAKAKEDDSATYSASHPLPKY